LRFICVNSSFTRRRLAVVRQKSSLFSTVSSYTDHWVSRTSSSSSPPTCSPWAVDFLPPYRHRSSHTGQSQSTDSHQSHNSTHTQSL